MGKHAEDMTKKKVEKQQRIKVLKTQISALLSECAKHKEQKEEYVKLKRFLDKLTPGECEWKEKQNEERLAKAEAAKRLWIDERVAEINAKIALECEEEDSRRAKAGEPELTAADRRKLRKKHPAVEQLEKMYMSVEDEDSPLYFSEPAQVLDIFTALEEQNLFLIQTAQETQQSVEEVEQKFANTKEKMEEKSNTLKSTIDLLEQKIALEKGKCEELKRRIQGETDGSAMAPDQSLLKELAHRVAEVSAVCGFESDRESDALGMLANLEAKLEELFAILDDMEQTPEGKELVLRCEREKEKERRDSVRAERLELQNNKNEERLRKTLQRSQAPVHKKVGKPVMFRSYVTPKVKKVVKEDNNAEEAERIRKLFGISAKAE